MSFDEEYLDDHHLCQQEIKSLESKLEIAREALGKIADQDFSGEIKNSASLAKDALARLD